MYGWIDLEFRKFQEQESSDLDEKWGSYGLWKFEILEIVKPENIQWNILGPGYISENLIFGGVSGKF